MIKKKSFSHREADLRKRAEESAREKSGPMPENLDTLTPEEISRLLHELRVHQIELEMQNEELLRAREELEASRARYFDLYDLAPVGYVTLSENGLILETNLTAATLLGVARGVLVKQTISRFILKEDQDIFYLQRKQLFETGEPQMCELRMVKHDGTVFWAHLETTAVQDADGNPVFRIVMSDNPERKRMEEALRESEDCYRSQVEAINDVAYSINSSGEFTYISPIVKNVLGYEPDEMTGRHFLEFAHQDDHDLLTRKFSELREGVVSYDEYRVIGKSGDVVWMRSQTSPILDIGGFAGGRGILVDISEKKRAEEALHRLKENFRRSLDESPLGVRIVTEEGETLYANRAILGIYGYDSIEELNTTPIQKRYARESYAEFQIRREKRRQGIDVPPEYTIDIIRKNGDVRHLRVFRKGILWDDKKQYQVIYQDITEHRQAEEKLAAKSHQLEETNTALRVLLRHREEDMREMEQKIVANVQKLVLPYVEGLRKLCLSPGQSSYLDIIDSNLQQVINPFLKNLTARFSVLTPREIQVSNLIREGKTSKEIADLIKAAPRSVEFHRNNIRKSWDWAEKDQPALLSPHPIVKK